MPFEDEHQPGAVPTFTVLGTLSKFCCPGSGSAPWGMSPEPTGTSLPGMCHAEMLGLLPGTPSVHSRPSSCLDSLACLDGTLWTAVQTAPHTVLLLVHGTGKAAASHAVLQLPEPVVAVQLAEAVGAARTAGAAAKQATATAAAVAVAVGAGGRVWAWRLPSATGIAEAGGYGNQLLGTGRGGDQSGDSRRVKRKLETAQQGKASREAAEQLEPWPNDSLAAAEQLIPIRPPLLLSTSAGRGPPPAATAPAAAGLPAAPSLHLRSEAIAARIAASCSVLAAEAATAGSFAVRGVENLGLRAQLAAQVAWEYLDALWQDGRELQMPGPEHDTTDAAAIPVPLPSLAAHTVAGQPQPQLPLLHSVATWAASGALPADACCACYVALPTAAEGGFLGSARTAPCLSSVNEVANTFSDGGAMEEAMDWEPQQGAGRRGWQAGLGSAAAVGGTAGIAAVAAQGSTLQPLGLLLVGTLSGEVAAFPVGTPVADRDAAGRGLSRRTSEAGLHGWGSAVAVVYGSCLRLVWLPPSSQQLQKQNEQQQQQPAMPAGRAPGCDGPGSAPRLVLHVASGRPAPAPPDPCSRVRIAGGSTVGRTAADGREGCSGGSSSGAGYAQAELGGLVVATIALSGRVDSVSVCGHLLFYTCRGELHCLDCSSLQQHLQNSRGSTEALPRAVHITTPIDSLLVAAAAKSGDLRGAACNHAGGQGAAAATGNRIASAEACRLVLLSRERLLLSMLCPVGAVAAEAERRRQRGASSGELEQQMQVLLSQVADLSTAQEHLSHKLLQLDSHIASLATTLPAVQSINCGPFAGLYCSVRPVYRLGTVLGAAPGQAAGLAVEVSLHNGGHWELPAGHSLVVTFSGLDAPADGAAPQQQIAHAAPLPLLSPGTTHTRTCFLAPPSSMGPLTAGTCAAAVSSRAISTSTSSSRGRRGCSQGMLRVLLCHHSSSKAGTAQAALLHSVDIDALRFTHPGPLPSMRPGPPFFLQQHQHSWQQQQQNHHGSWSALRQSQLGAESSAPLEARLKLLLPAWLFGRRPDSGAALQAILSQGLSSLDLSPASPTSSGPITALGAALMAGRVGGGDRTSQQMAVAAVDEDGAPGRDRSRTQKQQHWQQEERAARLARGQQLAAVQLGAGVVQAPTGAVGSIAIAGSSNSSAPGGAWWEPLLSQQRQAAAANRNPLVAFVSHSSTAGAAPRVPQQEIRASHPAAVCAELPIPAALLGATLAGRALAGSAAGIEVSARLLPGRGIPGGASWQHADLEITARTAGPAEAALQGHAALLRRVMAMQGSLPDRDPPLGLHFSSSALLAPQQGATSPAQSAIEGADESALEGVLCTLHQLKSDVMRLRDEALHAQQAQRALQGQQVGKGGADGAAKGSSCAAEECQEKGLQLRSNLVQLTLKVQQQLGRMPIIMA